MAPQSSLYRLVDPDHQDRATVLLVQLTGFIDAGYAGRLLGEHLLATYQPELVATFDLDQLLDYRGRRPAMVFDHGRWTSYDEPQLALYRLRTPEGTPFLLLSGPEPDYQWEAVVRALAELADRFGVTLTATVHGIPMAVPHTRPLGVTAHSNNPRLIGPSSPPFGQVQVPGSLAALLEYRFGEQGRDVVGAAVHVPHYLAQAEYAQAALVGLRHLAGATGLDLDPAALQEEARENLDEIGSEVLGNDEASSLVTALERQYDEAMRGRQAPSLLAADLGPLPSADELGAEFEAFLKDVSDEDPPAQG